MGIYFYGRVFSVIQPIILINSLGFLGGRLLRGFYFMVLFWVLCGFSLVLYGILNHRTHMVCVDFFQW